MASDQELLIKINGSAKQFNDEIDRVNKKTKSLQDNLGKVAKVSTVAFVGLAAAIGGTVARFSSFEKGFTNVQTLLDKSSFSAKSLSEGIDDLKNGVLEVGSKSGESLDVLNAGLFDLISAGVDAGDSISTLKVATDLAAAGATDTATAVKALTSVMTSFGDEAGTAQEISEKFFTAQKFGVTTVGELATSFNKVAGISKSLGLTFDETLASLSALTADGAKPTAEAATQLKAAFNSVILVQNKLKNESLAVQDALSLENVKTRGLTKSLDLLKLATGGSVPEMQRLLGSSEALSTMLSLTGAQSSLVKTQIDAMADSQGRAATFAEALRVKQETTEFALKRLKTSADAVAVTFGEVFAPTINALAGALTAVAQKLSSLSKGQVAFLAGVAKVALVVTGLTAALSILALGYLKVKAILIATNGVFGISATAIKLYNGALILGQRAAKLFSVGMKIATGSVRGLAAATGIGLVIVAISLLVTNFKEAKAVASGTFKAIGTVIDAFVKQASNLLGSLADILVGALTLDFNKVKSGLAGIGDGLGTAFNEIGKNAGDSFNEGYAESIAESDAAEALDAKGGGEDGTAALKAQLAEEQSARDEAAEIKTTKEQEIRDAKNEADAVNNQLKTENDDLIDQTEIEKLDAKLLTEAQIKQKMAVTERKKVIKRRNQFKEDEIKHGTTVAEFKQFLASDEVKLAGDTANSLVKLTNSKNSTLKGIGKAAALVNIGIDTARGSIAAYSALAGLGPAGPFLGAAAAGALIAFGGEQASNVLSAQRGGIVPGGQGGARDRIPALLEPGELVVPKSLAPDFQQAFGQPEPGVAENEGGAMEVTVGFKDDAFEIIEQKLLERRAIGVGGF